MRNGLYQTKRDKIWYKDMAVHRLNGPAQLLHNLYHRIKDPVIYYNNDSRLYYINGLIHSLNGPAIIGSYGGGYYEWYINGIDITEKLNGYCQANNIDIKDYKNLNKLDKLKLKFKFGLML